MRGEQSNRTPWPSGRIGSSPRAWGTASPLSITLDVIRFIPTCVGNSPGPFVFIRLPPVHPHVRGEQISKNVPGTSCRGSSPRAWGTAGARGRSRWGFRFIPTCVGNRYQAHCFKTFFRGSSPRAWGTEYLIPGHRWRPRFIPTCVGNSQGNKRSGQQGAVHPHVRGEQPESTLELPPVIGSSPRAWGTVCQEHLQYLELRFIPTCVGNSFSVRGPPRVITVHPHVRGEQAMPETLLRPTARFIPTCVGNSLWVDLVRPSSTVHPHVRGEQGSLNPQSSPQCGSSPRAWGTGDSYIGGGRGGRFIPTCVGNRRPLRMRAEDRSVHPHVRGEQGLDRSRGCRGCGSSPRAWGTVVGCGPKERMRRFIPTCVGNRL